ncbi:VOC family protein [Actinotalea sp.]|uniref:VOC family protein n=1 Tax=Actinotalea sp. TaxID=1872145 RepID=UPI00356928D0
MLATYNPMPTLAVADMARARAFYEGTLGFTVQRESEDGVVYGAGSGSFLVYSSGYAGTNKATAMSFSVPTDAFDPEVDALRAAGVSFQTFEVEGLTWADGVASWAESRSVWFEDPDGNILNVETGMEA